MSRRIAVARVVLMAAMLIAIATGATCAETYDDARRRFRVDVPAGWTASPQGDEVRISRGNAGVMIAASSGETPDGLVTRVAGQVGSQWSRFQEIARGTTTVSGRPAVYGFYSGVNLKGAPSFLRITAVPGEQDRLFALIATVPEAELGSLKPALDQIERSFSLATAPSVSPPARAPGPGATPGGQAFLGIGLRDLDAGESRMAGGAGALIGAVAPDSPAARAGMQPGDLITHVDRRPLARAADVPAAVAVRRPGDVLELTVVRQGRSTLVRVTLGAKP